MPRKLNPHNYHGWAKLVKIRDKFQCIFCGSSEKLEVDHIKPYSKYPNLRYIISNGRTLCHVCHKTTSTYGGRVRIWEE